MKETEKVHELSDEYACHLRNLVSKAAKADCEYKVFGADSHKYRLNPVTSLEKVRQFEQEYHITLPEEYVFFLTKVGNGGAGPHYGLYSLEKLRSNNYYKQNDNPVFIDENLTTKLWAEKVSEMERDDCTDEVYDAIEEQILAGALVIGTRGCSYDTLMMCKGSETGKIVYDDYDRWSDCPPFLTGMTFLDWFERFFEEIVAGHDVTSYGVKRLDTEEELIKAYAGAADEEEKWEILSSLWRFEKLSTQAVELLMNIKEKELDSIRVCLILKTDLEKGLAVFERLLEGENPTAAVGCLYSIPKEYKNNYYKRVLNLLYEEHNTDKSRILFFLSDCSCKKASDIVAFATDEQIEEYLRKDAIYVMGQCDDVLEYTKQFILWMKGDSRLIALTALQIMIRTKAASDDLIEAYKWMWTKYENDAEMRTSLQHAPSRFLSNWRRKLK